LTVDQEKGGGGSSCGDVGVPGGRVEDVSDVEGSVQDETDPTGIIIITSRVIPIERRLQAEDAAHVGLKLVKQGHLSP